MKQLTTIQVPEDAMRYEARRERGANEMATASGLGAPVGLALTTRTLRRRGALRTAPFRQESLSATTARRQDYFYETLANTQD